MKVTDILIFIVIIALVCLMFYGIYRLMVSKTMKQLPNFTDERLVKAYKNTNPILIILVSLVVFVLFPGLGVVVFFYNRRMRKEYALVMQERSIEIPK
ncbi:hypothetical protein [Thorsellia anophelis]|uniref:Uncharacterized protein n=1 Tax=Thorsellia anophelis DSM 18579 TaxID=1123402 RepID=A0A1H9YDX8_9GAMM|nr:hypothetical protein [Thorsellia anophelis]SES67066.1 hypothetical protein SAMN02583745_00203 [Thorsellia anophelis DSM 18579]